MHTRRRQVTSSLENIELFKWTGGALERFVYVWFGKLWKEVQDVEFAFSIAYHHCVTLYGCPRDCECSTLNVLLGRME